jgi:hypothetical protein
MMARRVRVRADQKEVRPMRTSPGSLLLLVAVVLFILVAVKVSLGDLDLLPIGLAAFAASFLFGHGGGIFSR